MQCGNDEFSNKRRRDKLDNGPLHTLASEEPEYDSDSDFDREQEISRNMGDPKPPDQRRRRAEI